MLSQTRNLTRQCVAKIVSQRGAATLSLWSESLSFATPESDFTTGRPQREYATSTSSSSPSWSGALSYSSPESDFSGRSFHSVTEHQELPASATVWSHQLSFASPESDFSFDAAAATNDSPNTVPEWSHTLSFASPESDFTSSRDGFPVHEYDHDDMDNFYSLAMTACPESAFGSIAMQELLDDRLKWKLQQVLDSHKHFDAEQETIEAFLPRTLAEAMAELDPRAIVVTTASAPFEIIHVNNAWEGLCGFSKDEALHHNLSLLQGPETDRNQAQRLLQELQRGHAASAVLTNYTKQGRAFKNLVRVAPIRDESRRISHFVGVLEEVPNQTQWDERDNDRHMMRAA